MKNKKTVAITLIIALVAGGLWLFRYNLSFGKYYAVYDITVTDTLEISHRESLMFGTHSFSAGGFKGNAMNIGVSAPIPDSAIQEFFEYAKRDPKYITIDENGHHVYDGPTVEDPPSRYVKIPVRSRLPKRSMFQKYAFHFTIYPHDSVGLEILLLDKSDCSHIDKTAATAYLSSGPCSY
jgi:hypothetical protein